MLTGWGRDLATAWRTACRSPQFALFVIALLALGMGGGGALVALLETVVLRPLPSPHADRLALLEVVTPQGAHRLMPLTTLDELDRRQTVFDAQSGYTGHVLLPARIDGRVTATAVAIVSGNYFDLLGVTPRLGRLLTDADNRLDPGDSTLPVVIGHEFWSRELGGREEVVGESFMLDGTPVTVVGVTPPAFRGLSVEGDADITVTMNDYGRIVGVNDPRVGVRANYVIARLRPGVTLEQAEPHVRSVWPAARDASAPPVSPRELDEFLSQDIRFSGFRNGFSVYRSRYGEALDVLLWLLAALLVLASANLAGLLVARNARRSDEWRVRRALGAGPWHLLRLAMSESAIYVVLGTIAAVPLAYWASGLLVAVLWVGRGEPDFSAAPGGWTFGLLAAAASATTLVMSALPAWLAAEAGRTSLVVPATVVRRPSRVVRSLVAGQLAVSLVVVFLAVVLTRNLAQWWSADPGYDRSGVIMAQLSQVAGAGDADAEAVEPAAYLSRLVESVRAVPGVEHASLSQALQVFSLTIGRPTDLFTQESGETPVAAALQDRAAPGLFATLGVPLVAGRDFTWADDLSQPRVVVVTRDLANAIAPGGAVGRRIRVGTESELREIVGVVENMGTLDPRMGRAHLLFRAMAQEPNVSRVPVVTARTSGQFRVEALREAVESSGRHYVVSATTMTDRTGVILMSERVTASLGFVLAVLALVIAATGLTSLLVTLVEGRRREFGVRLALGASRGSLVRAVGVETLLLAAVGVGIGVPAALGAGRLTSALLINVTPTDPAALIAATMTLAAVTIGAGLAPALRAARTDPLTALRGD